jgi:dolichol-phosphate mannosyltransferase
LKAAQACFPEARTCIRRTRESEKAISRVSDSVQVSVVIPVKDEAGNVVPLAREIAAALGGERYEAIFVDDGSRDATASELLGLRGEMPIRVLSHSRNQGQSRAVRTGVRAAKGHIVVTLDGDGQNDPADIPKLLAGFRAGAVDPNFGMLAGEREKREDSWKKRMASRYGNRVRRWLLSDNAKDTGCGLKVFGREAFLTLPYFDHMHRYLITLMLREGYEVRFMPVGHRPRGAGRSKYGVWDRAWVGLADLIGVLWLKRRFRGPDNTVEL